MAAAGMPPEVEVPEGFELKWLPLTEADDGGLPLGLMVAIA
eukprot:CAMPEP_0177539482 /NCGR_PEP_ID=MMETSP0369-20130122/58987_1 /TAXON_ID=447022 ORGANISM="Scrippsiella hangoei-like, Strain SHHI-4" /NCGR_SAMPLE_ID=MMETSP0369 /ASSEMBLY_ACC=CAM_ASM_000364 /LENGTH=40 /DNA_ID= /DNA_START= /DNA_END= /DNA_ORIENTATION=